MPALKALSSSRLQRSCATIVAGALALALLPSPAAASPFAITPRSTIQEPDAAGGGETEVETEAKAAYKAGSDAYALGNYEEAVGHFERAFELSNKPALLFNLGQAYTRWYDISNDIEHLKKARRLYENYVLNIGATQLDEQEQADARADAQRRIAEVDRRISEHEEAPPAGPIDDGEDEQNKPVYKKAWFWLAILGGAAVVGGGIATAVILTRPRDTFEPELGTIGRAPAGGVPGGLVLRF